MGWNRSPESQRSRVKKKDPHKDYEVVVWLGPEPPLCFHRNLKNRIEDNDHVFTDDSLYPENMQPLIITAAPYVPSRLGNRSPARQQGGGVPRPRLVLRRDHRNDNECSRLRSRLVTQQKSATKKSWSPLHEGYLTKQYE